MYFVRQHLQLILLVLLMALISSFASLSEFTRSFDRLFFDGVQQFSQLPDADDIVIIDIDEKSIQQLGRWPWSRNVHGQLLEQLIEHNTGPVVFDVIFAEPDLAHPQHDLQLSQAVKQHGQVILPIYMQTLSAQGQVLEIPPAQIFYTQVAGVGHVNVNFDDDGIVRRVFLKQGLGQAYWPHLSLALWQQLNPNPVLPGLKNNDPLQAGDHRQLLMGDYLNLLAMPSETQGLLHHSFVDVVKGKVDPATLHNKIIFVGATAAGLGDWLSTSVGAMAGVELNAWVFQALRHEQFIQVVPRFLQALSCALLVMVALFLLGRLSPKSFLLCSLLLITSLLSISGALQLWGRLYWPVMPIILAVVLFYPLWSWLRLEVALRFLRRELSQLNLSQSLGENPDSHYEQLKQGANFLSRLGFIKDWSIEQGSKQQSSLKTLSYQVTDSSNALQLAVNWQQPLHMQTSTEQRITPRGTELIGQTIERLNFIKRKADANQKLIRQSLAQLQDGVIITDLCGRLLFANQAYYQLLGEHGSLDLLSQLERIELDSQQTWAQVIRKLYTDSLPFTSQGFIADTNKDVYCQLRLANIESMGMGKGVGAQQIDTLILTITDISLLKAAEKSRLEALNFLSHDLRSPMVSVLAIIGGQQGQAQIDAQILQPIETLVRKNLSYADSFLQLSRAQALQTTQLYLCDLHSVLDSAQMQGLAMAKSKNIELITTRYDDDAWVLGDDDLLERAMNNLLSNAIKYSEANTQVELKLAKHGDVYELSVQDQGCGIAKADLPHVFERFTRAKHKQQQAGAGLGLNFVATVAHRHHGEVSVSSDARGSVFTLRLPAHTPPLDE